MSIIDLFEEADKRYDSGDFVSAFNLFLELAENGDDSAMSRIACMYFDGEGASKDIKKSIEWDLKAIGLGNSSSMLNLAISYRALGEIKLAKFWFEKSLASGNGEAALHLAKLYMVSDKEADQVRDYLRAVVRHDFVSEETIVEAKKLLDELSKAGQLIQSVD